MIGAMGVTEPGAGSDVSSIQTTARREGDVYVLNGTKQFITNGAIADIHVVFATLDRSKGWKGIAAFLIDETKRAGLGGTKKRRWGSGRPIPPQIILEDVRVRLKTGWAGNRGIRNMSRGMSGH